MKKIFDENGLLSGKRVLAATLVMVLLSSMTFFSAAAGHTWKSQGNVEAIKSDGSKTVVFDKSDLDYLDGRIDAIEADVSTGKENLANALNPLGTNPSLGTPLSGTSTFNELMEAINHSQAIPDKTIGESVSIATEDYELASKVTGQTINSDTKISAATADNLSLGTSAWVDGSLLIGTGADNKNYYEQDSIKIYKVTTVDKYVGSPWKIECDLSYIDGYEAITASDFIFQNIGIKQSNQGNSVGMNVKVVYDPSKGIVTISKIWNTGVNLNYFTFLFDLYVIPGLHNYLP